MPDQGFALLGVSESQARAICLEIGVRNHML